MKALLENRSYRDPDDPGEVSTGQPRISVTYQEGRVLRRLFKGCRVLEIGTGLGVSTAWLAVSASWVHTVDPDPWVAANTWPGLTSQFENVLCYQAIDEVAPVRFDGAFVDGNHHYWAVVQDLREVLVRVAPGALMVVHDAGFGDVAKAVGECGLTMRVIKTAYQLGVIRCP